MILISAQAGRRVQFLLPLDRAPKGVGQALGHASIIKVTMDAYVHLAEGPEAQTTRVF